MTGFSTKKLLLITLFVNFVAIAGVIIRAILLEKGPYRYFDEGSLINWLSGVQLLIIGGINWQIYNLRKASRSAKDKQLLWQFFAFGFVFCCLDEILQIHERFDKFIHWIFQIQETPLTDSIDDVIILMYGIIGLLVIYYFRQEFYYYRDSFPYFKIALILACCSIGLDFLTQGQETEILTEAQEMQREWLRSVEEIFKLFTEVFLIASFYKCLRIAKTNKS
ncbi:MAG: hypothetical protein QNJ68_01750 [Microcoleaceae cyanobacterium MO_207.B10]|nr:hypothetical protein [Microcoleaceae cyanobacterium MO_207.B10]